MATTCTVCREVFDDDRPLCEIHLRETQPCLPAAITPAPPPGPAPTLEPAPAPGVVLRLAGVEVALSPETPVLIGRSPHSPFGASLEGIGWTNIGGLHCTVQLGDGVVMVTDLDSRNGTFIDGARLTPQAPRPLAPGQRLRLAANREVELKWS